MSGADDTPMGADGKLWRCDACGVLRREVHDPTGPVHIRTLRGGGDRRVRYEPAHIDGKKP